jgi:hypothetical protein
MKGRLVEVKLEIVELNVESTVLQVYEEYRIFLNEINEDFVKIQSLIVEEIDRIETAKEKSSEEIEKLFEEHSAKFLEVEKAVRMIRADLQVKIAEKLIVREEDQHRTSRPAQRNNLPKMKLPYFTGEYKDWPTFKEKFIRIVDEDAGIPIIYKFGYLLDSLSDAVKIGIKKLDFVEANYAKAFEILEKKYNNKKVTVDNHISEIVTDEQ